MTGIGGCLLIYMCVEKTDNNRVKDLRVLPCIFNDPIPFHARQESAYLLHPRYTGMSERGLKELPDIVRLVRTYTDASSTPRVLSRAMQ